MRKEYRIIVAGFGGQGILFLGKLIAYYALFEDREVTWLPSYGPEMRGGTACCHIIISDKKIGSPIIDKPNVLITMNKPSYDKYISSLADGGKLYVDSSLVDNVDDTNINNKNIITHCIPATKLAEENNLTGLANMIMMGNVIKWTSDFYTDDKVKEVISHLSKGKANVIEKNMQAILLGKNFD